MNQAQSIPHRHGSFNSFAGNARPQSIDRLLQGTMMLRDLAYLSLEHTLQAGSLVNWSSTVARRLARVEGDGTRNPLRVDFLADVEPQWTMVWGDARELELLLDALMDTLIAFSPRTEPRAFAALHQIAQDDGLYFVLDLKNFGAESVAIPRKSILGQFGVMGPRIARGRRTANLHGGDLSGTRADDGSVAFRLLLPVALEPPVSASPRGPSMRPRTNSALRAGEPQYTS